MFEDIDRYIVEEVYGGTYGKWIDYPKDYMEKTRIVKYLPFEIFGTKYKKVYQWGDGISIEYTNGKQLNYTLPREKESDGKSIPASNKLIQKYYEYANLEHMHTGSTNLIDNSKIGKLKQEYITYFNTVIKDAMIDTYAKNEIEVVNLSTYDNDTYIQYEFEYKGMNFTGEFDHAYFSIFGECMNVINYHVLMKEKGYRGNYEVSKCVVDDKIDVNKFRKMVEIQIEILELYINTLKIYPVGTTVRLKDNQLKDELVVITDRFLSLKGGSKKYYEYKGKVCKSETIKSEENSFLFNNEDIKQVQEFGEKNGQEAAWINNVFEKIEREGYKKATTKY